MSTALITLTKVKKVFEGANHSTALAGLSAVIHRGERVAVVGQNGSGKSTLLRLLLGLIQPSSGTVENTFAADAQLHWLPQDYRNALLPWLSFRQNLLIAFRHDERTSSTASDPTVVAEFERAAKQFHLDLDLDTPTARASGGELQLFLLIRALIGQPDVLVLDEPLSAVDYARKQLIREFLGRELGHDGATAIIATHDFDDAVFLADRVLVLAKNASGIQAEVHVALPWPRTDEMREGDLYTEAISAVTRRVLT